MRDLLSDLNNCVHPQSAN